MLQFLRKLNKGFKMIFVNDLIFLIVYVAICFIKNKQVKNIFLYQRDKSKKKFSNKEMHFYTQFQFEIFTRIFSEREVRQIVSMSDENLQKIILLSGKIYYQLIHSRNSITRYSEHINKQFSENHNKKRNMNCKNQKNFLQTQKNQQKNSEHNDLGLNEEETYFLNYSNILKAYKIKNMTFPIHEQERSNFTNRQQDHQESKCESHLLINMQMHYLNMKAKSLLAKNFSQNNKHIKKCKMMLKKFIQKHNLLHKNLPKQDKNSQNIYDLMLISITFSNLGVLYQKQNKPYKSLPYLIKALQCCFKHKNQIKQNEKISQKQTKYNANFRNKEVRQTVIVLVNCLALIKSSLKIILNQFYKPQQISRDLLQNNCWPQHQNIYKNMGLNKNSRQYLYIELNEIINYLGYRYSTKYLGEQSHFTKKFTKINLKLFEQQKKNQQSKSFQQNIFNSLIKIQNLLEKMSQPKQQIKVQIPLPQKKVKRQQLLKPQKLQLLQVQSQISHHINQNNQSQQFYHEVPPFQKEQSSFLNQQVQKYNISVNNLPVNSIKHSIPKDNFQSKILEKQSVMIGDWNLQVQFCRILNLNISKKYLKFQAKNAIKKLKFTESIQYQKLITILTLINLQNTLPYEYSIQILPKTHFISYCVLPYLDIEDYQKNVQSKDSNNQNKVKQQKKPHIVITPMSKGLVLSSQIESQLQTSFMNMDCLLFLNHIRSNNFRLCIAPKKQSKCIYLNLFLNIKKISKYFEIQSTQKDFSKCFQQNCKSPYQKQQQAEQLLKNEKKEKLSIIKTRILDQPYIEKLIRQILKFFQSFLTQSVDQTNINQILNETQNYYFQFRQHPQGFSKGTFFKVYFNEIHKQLQIYAENTFKSYGINQRTKARGSDIYTSDQLQKEFGISFGVCDQFKEHCLENKYFNSNYQHQHEISHNQTRNHCQLYPLKSSSKLISELLCLKYDLIYFQKPLSEDQKDQYNENSIFKYEIASQSFHTEIISLLQNDSERITPISICLMIVNNEIPIGLKIQSYNIQETSRNQDFCCFIYIWQGDWLISANQKNRNKKSLNPAYNKEQRKNQSNQTSTQQSSMFIDHVLNFTYKTDYFIDRWLKKQGFRLLFETILFQNGKRESFQKSLRSDSKSRFGIRNIKNKVIIFEEIADQLIEKIK